MHRRTFLRTATLAATVPLLGGTLVGCDDEPPATEAVPTIPGSTATGSVRRAYGRDGSGFALHVDDGAVRMLDATGNEFGGLAMGEHAHPIAASSGLDGTIAVIDASHRRLELYGPDGRALGSIADDRLVGPRDVVFLDDGTIVVADSLAHRIVGLDHDGNERFSFGSLGTSGASLNGPTGLALGADSVLHVADRGNARIATFRLDGSFVGSIGRYGRGDGEFVSPRSIACDAAGRVYVADAIRGDVQVFDSGAFASRIVPDGVPVAVAFTPAGELYIALS